MVTCGPAHEPIDEVRRITNASTGELGVLLAEELARAGHEVTCFKGEGATFPGPKHCRQVKVFSTNESLLAQLQARAEEDVGAVFHVAALCDYRVKAVRDGSGEVITDAKISSRAGLLSLELEPAPKIIVSLRSLFPKARIVGWKYELNGACAEALRKGWQQIQEHHTDACVVNGKAYGAGFGVCRPPDRVDRLPSKSALCTWLVRWLAA